MVVVRLEVAHLALQVGDAEVEVEGAAAAAEDVVAVEAG